jgi:hypothetical protein
MTDQAICNKTHLIEAYSNFGNLLQDYGMLTDAITNYEKAYELAINMFAISDLFPDNYKSLEDIANYYRKTLEQFITLMKYELYTASLDKKGINLEQIAKSEKTNQKTILIVVSAFNRKKITRLSLAQTKRYKETYCHLQLYNDHSTEYDNSFLEPLADEVIILPEKMGIHDLRYYQLRNFLETDFDFMYMTDNDIIHDPQYIKVLETLYNIGDCKLPVCLYNSPYHSDDKTVLYNKRGIMIKKTAPGVSMFLDRKMVEKIVNALNKIGNDHDMYGWDYMVIAYLGLPWISPEISFLEHYGGGGLHNIDFEIDRAINPTQYLKDRRNDIIKYLTEDVNLQILF